MLDPRTRSATLWEPDNGSLPSSSPIPCRRGGDPPWIRHGTTPQPPARLARASHRICLRVAALSRPLELHARRPDARVRPRKRLMTQPAPMAPPRPLLLSVALFAALGGAATSLAQDILGGRPLSVDDALQSAAPSGATSGLVSPMVSAGVNRMRPSAQGKPGERLSEGRSRLRGNAPREGGTPHVPIGGGAVAIPDHQTPSGLYVEAQSGPSAHLTQHNTTTLYL